MWSFKYYTLLSIQYYNKHYIRIENIVYTIKLLLILIFIKSII